jgi:hypothetical protein
VVVGGAATVAVATGGQPVVLGCSSPAVTPRARGHQQQQRGSPHPSPPLKPHRHPHQVDAIGGARHDDGAGGDNEVQRTMLEIVNQLDGFDSRGNIKVRGRAAGGSCQVLTACLRAAGAAGARLAHTCSHLQPTTPPSQVLMATNRPDTLDPALLRPGRLDRKVEFGLPDLEGRTQIFQIHTRAMACERDIRFELLGRLCPNSTGADIRSVCTEAVSRQASRAPNRRLWRCLQPAAMMAILLDRQTSPVIPKQRPATARRACLLSARAARP